MTPSPPPPPPDPPARDSAPGRGWRDRVLASGAAVRLLWFLAPAVTWIVDFSRGRHNTYKIYRQAFWHLLERRNLYLAYPLEHGDVNLYGPVFGLVIAPFALLPDAAGGLLWNLAMAGVLSLALGRLGLAPARRLLVLALCAVELMNASWSNQFNPAVAALLLLTFAAVEGGHEFTAPLWVLLGAFVKVYTAVGLLFVLFARDRKAFLAGCVAWSAVLLLLPMLVSSPAFVLQSYQDWLAALVHKNGANVVLYTSQDISVMGLVRRAVGQPIASGWFYLVVVPLVLAPLLRVGQHAHRSFRLLYLASLLMFVVLFSSGSESSTYVVAATGAALWLAQQEAPFRPRNLILMAGLLLAGLAPTDLLSVAVRHLTNRYAWKALPYAVVWALLVRDLLTLDFARAADPAPSEA